RRVSIWLIDGLDASRGGSQNCHRRERPAETNAPLGDYSLQATIATGLHMRTTFSALSTLFGGLGIFLLYLSWLAQSELPGVYALIFLGSATCMVSSLQHGHWARKR